jgi:hypothetical protein
MSNNVVLVQVSTNSPVLLQGTVADEQVEEEQRHCGGALSRTSGAAEQRRTGGTAVQRTTASSGVAP